MVIYAQRVQHVTALGVPSAMPARHECAPTAVPASARFSGSGMPIANEASAWLRGTGSAPATARELRLGNTALPMSTTPTTKPDAFVGIHPGPRTSTSPPV